MKGAIRYSWRSDIPFARFVWDLHIKKAEIEKCTCVVYACRQPHTWKKSN